MFIIEIVVLLIVIIVTAILIFAATRPNDFRVLRSLDIKAPPEKIFGLIDDFHHWATWSPYEKLDSALKRSFSGTQSGKGAVYGWEGNGKAGAGRMEITDAVAPSLVAIKLDFTRPFRASNTVDFILEPDGDVTRVSWAMQGRSPYMAKVMGLFMSMDNLIGRDFEQGLANLKAATE